MATIASPLMGSLPVVGSVPEVASAPATDSSTAEDVIHQERMDYIRELVQEREKLSGNPGCDVARRLIEQGKQKAVYINVIVHNKHTK